VHVGFPSSVSSKADTSFKAAVCAAFRRLAAYAERTVRTKRIKAIRDTWKSSVSFGDLDHLRLGFEPA
jgi:hypothetical protein